MPNHFHVVIQLTLETLSKGMQWLNGKYARAFNRRHGYVGHLFQGRFDAQLVDKNVYFLELLRYVVLNPVRAGIVARPGDYLWSSHRAVIGSAPAAEWLAIDDALVQFGPDHEIARAAYDAFVNSAIGVESMLWKNLVGQVYLGRPTSSSWSPRPFQPMRTAFATAVVVFPAWRRHGLLATKAC